MLLITEERKQSCRKNPNKWTLTDTILILLGEECDGAIIEGRARAQWVRLASEQFQPLLQP